ncbi:hypothetical protein GOP47_0029548, partial [Adiantum capillus-veneris]
YNIDHLLQKAPLHLLNELCCKLSLLIISCRRMACRMAKRGMATTADVSRSLDDAKRKVMSFFKDCCRALPTIIHVYILDETISRAELRSKIASEFRKHENVQNPQVIDMLVFKGQEELHNILSHSKQRHHILSEYIVGQEGLVQPLKLGIADHGESDFLKKFYISNRT